MVINKTYHNVYVPVRDATCHKVRPGPNNLTLLKGKKMVSKIDTNGCKMHNYQLLCVFGVKNYVFQFQGTHCSTLKSHQKNRIASSLL